MKKSSFKFVGNINDLLEAIEWEIDMKEQRELEEGFNSNSFCDNYGYCSEICKYYNKCKGVN